VAHRIAPRRRLDLDHVGAEVAEQRPHVRPRQQLAELDHAEPTQWTVRQLHGRTVRGHRMLANCGFHVPPPRAVDAATSAPVYDSILPITDGVWGISVTITAVV